MFWRKGNSALKNSAGNLILCGQCPCPYYGLFALVYNSYDQQTGKVNYCYPNLLVTAAEVLDNKIEVFTNAQRCIPIQRQPDGEGKVGYQKSCVDCWMDCYEWDENGNCTDEHEFCMDCSEITVYRMSPCFDQYAEFAEWFYGGCNRLPDSEGKYPDIFYSGNMTNEANSCVNDHWYEIASRKYLAGCQIKFDLRHWGFDFFPYTQRCAEITECYSYCSGNCLAYDDQGNCSECDGEIQQDCMTFCDHPIEETLLVRPAPGTEPFHYRIGGSYHWDSECNNGQGCNVYTPPNCCEFWAGSRDALAQMIEYDENGKQDLENYLLKSTEEKSIPSGSNHKCWAVDYEAYHGCYTYSGPCWQFWHAVHYGLLTVTQPENAPSNAIGVKVRATAYTQKTNDEAAIIKNQRDYLYDNTEISLFFGEEMQLPVVDNMQQYHITNEQDCYGDDDPCQNGGAPEYAPTGWHSTTETFHLELAVVKYILQPETL